MSPAIKLRIDFVPSIEKQPYTLKLAGNIRDGKPIQVLVDTVLSSGNQSAIYRGRNTEINTVLVLKLCFVQGSIDVLDTEARHYNELKEFQGEVVPICFGYFKGRVAASPVACLVLEFCGEPLACPFVDLSLEQRLQILHKILKLHQYGRRHSDTAEHNVLVINNDFRIIDLHEIKDHVCKFAGDFHEGKQMPDAADFGCHLLWVQCLDMKIWDSGMVRVARLKVPKDEFPSQDVIDERTPAHGPNLTRETRDKLIDYLKDMRKKLDNGVPLEEIPPFTEDKVLIGGQLFPADQYPDQNTIDRFTPKPMNRSACFSPRIDELATYFRGLKATQEAGGDIYGLKLDWPSRLKGDDWPGERSAIVRSTR